MTRRDVIDFCLAFPFSYEDYPFGAATDPDVWTVMRHKANKKSFALIYERHGKLCVNVKCDPVEAVFLRQAFSDVNPAYHMNKEYWNTITIGGDVPEETVRQMTRRSYELTRPKRKREER